MENNDTSICPLCRHEKVKIFAVGDCLHPVCHLCSTKMRILCEQTYCAICRQELSKVYLISDIAEAQSAIDQSRFTPIDGTGDCGIYYPTKAEWIRRDTEKLLRNFCPFCHSEYETFEILRDHVRRTHRYFYCDLCVEHVNLFPFERKCYTRHDLVQHTRYGDRDDTSFKGHPLCRFCDDHFLDVDQLYKHMRKEHYYCHLCTTDNVYYSDFDLLRDHYRTTHYLCEIDQCKDVQFTNVFASETDFRAHQAAQHGKSRAHARQLGTLAVEFQSTSMRDRKQQHEPTRRGVFKSGEFDTQGNTNSTRNERDETHTEPAVPVAVPSINEFPTLGERSTTPQNLSQRGAWSNDQSKGIHSHTEFPALTSGTANVSNSKQPRGIWREQQQQQQQSSSPATQNTPSKNVPQPNKPIPNGATSMTTTKEDFPALKAAANTKIPAPVSMFSAWTTAKKSAKNASATAKGNQPQMRMNTNRLLNDDEDEEYIRRPMASLTTSTAPAASSNITMITSSDLSTVQSNDKHNKAKNQSLPNAQDFPALSTTSTTQNTASSGVWTAVGTNPLPKSPATQQKKKNSGMSKKKFIEEIQSMPAAAPPSLSSTNDFPAIGLSELGRRLIIEENNSALTTQSKEEQPPPSQSVKKEETSSTVQSKKKPQKSPKTNEPVKEETSLPKNENPPKPIKTQVPSQTESIPQPEPPPPPSIVPPPGFAALSSISPPPGFSTIPAPQSPTYIFPSSYTKQKNDFRAKLFDLFDGDMNLFSEYDKFCEAFSQKKISTKDFLTYTRQLFKDKLDEYLLDLLIIIPNIEQQNELYTIWKTDIHPSATIASNTSNWTKKNSDENNIYICRICQQIMFDNDTDEHNTSHSEFNTQFPSLPAASLPLGRTSGKKKK